MAQPVDHRFNITRTPEMPFETRAPLRRQSQRIDQRTEQPQIVDTPGKILQPANPQSLDRQRQDFAIAGGRVLQTQQFHARLRKLSWALRITRLSWEKDAV